MIDATKAVEAARRVRVLLETEGRASPKEYTLHRRAEDAALLTNFVEQVERERAAMPAKLERLRDELAGRALQGWLAAGPSARSDTRVGDRSPEAYAEEAYAHADAMLKARETK